MRNKLTIALLAIFSLCFSSKAAEQNDTIYNPNIIFSSMPKTYEIAGLRVTGLQYYEDYIVIGYSGLAVGDRIEIPGNEITNATKRFWRQGLFSKIQIKVEKICGDKAWLVFDLRQQPRISKIEYVGVKKGEKEDLETRLNLMPGNQITQNIVNRAEDIVAAFISSKKDLATLT